MRAWWVVMLGLAVAVPACGRDELPLAPAGYQSDETAGRGGGSSSTANTPSAIDCSVEPHVCACGTDIPESVDVRDGDCHRFDLAVLDVVVCGGCGSATLYVRVANRGRTTFDDAFQVMVDNGDHAVRTGTLAPGEVSEPVAVPLTSAAHTLTVGAGIWGDCDPANDVFALDPRTNDQCAR